MAHVVAAGKKHEKTVSASNVIDDPMQSRQTFDLLDLQQYTLDHGEQGFSSLLRRP